MPERTAGKRVGTAGKRVARAATAGGAPGADSVMLAAGEPGVASPALVKARRQTAPKPLPSRPLETPVALTRRARKMYRLLTERYPDAHIELDFTTPLELLVATILSAQSTDVRVNLTTPALFAKYHTAGDYAGADRTELETLIKSTGFFRAKSDALLKLGARLVADFGGEVPNELEQLVTLPGVGRKTANVVLGNAFGIPGMVVDTHIGRLSRRFGWTVSDDPVVIERDLMALFARKDWTMVSHRMIFHGRRTCHARTAACGACVVSALCPSYGVGETDPVKAAKLVKDGNIVGEQVAVGGPVGDQGRGQAGPEPA